VEDFLFAAKGTGSVPRSDNTSVENKKKEFVGRRTRMHLFSLYSHGCKVLRKSLHGICSLCCVLLFLDFGFFGRKHLCSKAFINWFI